MCCSLFLEEERIAEILTRYYGVKEILLPLRKLGERMPSSLMEFYNSLKNEMAYALSAEAIEEKNATTLNGTYKEYLKISFFSPITIFNYHHKKNVPQNNNRCFN